MKKNIIMILTCAFFISAFGSCKKQGPNANTIKNLKAAITGETTASAKYAAFAQKAKEEGYMKIAALFAAASRAEAVHAAKEREVLEKLGVKMGEINPKFEVKTTKENLKKAIEGESYEVATMYPDFIKAAEKEKVEDAIETFNEALEVEKIHKDLYSKILAKLDSKDFKDFSDKYYVCLDCGNTVPGNAPESCSICGESKEKFELVTIK